MRAVPILAVFLLAAVAFAPRASAPPPKDWTILVYMDADNNLEQWGIADFLEMATVGSTANLNIVVQFDRVAGYDASFGDWTDTKRFYVTKDQTPDPANELGDLGEVNMADPANLSAFVEWGMAAYPATHYFLVLWDHGDGWQGVVTDDNPVANDRLTAIELRDALRDVVTATGRRVDLVGIDACRMTLEIDYELQDYADYFVGSEKDEPLPGWPYDTVLAPLAASTTMSPSELASWLVDKYVESYQGTSEYSVALSAVSAANLRPLVSTLNAYLGEVSAEEPYFTTQVVLARDATEHYEIGGMAGGLEYDLYDFVENVAAGTGSRRLEQAGAALESAIASTVVHERHWDNPTPVNGVHAARAHGLSLYFPTTGPGAQYAALTFSQESLWDEFLGTYAVGTRPQVAANADGSSIDANRDGYLDTLLLAYAPAANGTMVIEGYRDGASAFSGAYAAHANRSDRVRYALSAGGRYEVSFYLFVGGTLQNLTVVPGLVIEQLVTFQGRVTRADGSAIVGASVTLADLANGNTATGRTNGDGYSITVVYPTWFAAGDPLELRVVSADREARLGFNGSVGDGTVVHDVRVNAVDQSVLFAALAASAGLAAAGILSAFVFWRRLRRSKKPPPL